MAQDSAARVRPSGPPLIVLTPDASVQRRWMPVRALFTATIFVSAFLLFLVQPLFARMVLPLLGGSPSVWNTALMFYQAVLLLGYGYAHLSGRLSVKRQIQIQAVLVLLPLVLMPIAIRTGDPVGGQSPVLWLLITMAASVGLPFFVVSSTSPLLQRWYAATGSKGAADPYFLYAASNIGSMIALLGYPLLIEPKLRLAAQSGLWAFGYGLYVVLVIICGAVLWKTPGALEWNAPAPEDAGRLAAPTWPRRIRWILLAFVPSSLMIGATTYMSTDIAAVPMLWVIPLALYLLTFIIVFARKPLIPHKWMVAALPPLLVALVLALAIPITKPLAWLFPLHLVTFFVAAMVCHGEMANDRPSVRYLTEFFFLMSVGGVLGGLFNAIIAPTAFKSILEYPLTLLLACLLLPKHGSREMLAEIGSPNRTAGILPAPHTEQLQGEAGRMPAVPSDPFSSIRDSVAAEIVAAKPDEKPGKVPPFVLDLAGPLSVACLAVILIRYQEGQGLTYGWRAWPVMFAAPALMALLFVKRPARFALAVVALYLVGLWQQGTIGRVVYEDRGFFGVLRVREDAGKDYRRLLHGTTLHGIQATDPALARTPLSYYYPTGPIGEVFDTLDLEGASIAAVGLGVGSLAGYSKAGQTWDFYEIDPEVEKVARDPRFFTYLADSPAQPKVILGDARLSLAASPTKYKLIVLDAYSSDSVPIHLITKQALAMYRERLLPDGVLAFHISNRHLDLEPVLGRLAEDAGLFTLTRSDLTTPEERQKQKASSTWTLMANSESALGAIAEDPRWTPTKTSPTVPLWTDDYSSVLSVLRKL
ncbi:MAG: fused MFS/spermidine synthase [Fimbriimonadaceae bacterium]|nr:fused MFS/spermidine synthase [Fimbriimonadaceae bacterium]